DDRGLGIAVDAEGNVYTTGLFSGTVNFNPNNGKAQNLSGGGVFVSKLDASGNFVAAAGLAGSSSGSRQGNGRAIAIDGSGNVYTTGVFFGTADFNPTSGSYNITANGSIDAFVSKLTQDSASKAKAAAEPGPGLTAGMVAVDDRIDWLAAAAALKPKGD